MSERAPETEEDLGQSLNRQETKPVEFDAYVGATTLLVVLYSAIVQLPHLQKLPVLFNFGAYLLLEVITCVGIMKGSRLAFSSAILLYVYSYSQVTEGSYQFAEAFANFSDVQKTIYYFAGFALLLSAIYCAGRLANAFRENPKA